MPPDDPGKVSADGGSMRAAPPRGSCVATSVRRWCFREEVEPSLRLSVVRCSYLREEVDSIGDRQWAVVRCSYLREEVDSP